MASWSKEKVLQFIELYRSEECLWRLKSKDYSNRFLKEKAYKKLVAFVKTIDSAANKDHVLKKINNLRGSFRKEYKKVNCSKLSHNGANEVYQPKLWYFSHLLFLRNQEAPGSTCSSLGVDTGQDNSESIPDTEDAMIFRCESADSCTPVSDLDVSLDVEDSLSETRSELGEQGLEPRPEAKPGPSHSHISSQSRARKTTKRKVTEKDDLLKHAQSESLHSRVPPQREDQFDLYGKTVAHKLRGLPRNQRLFAERLCSEVLFEAELGNLTRQSTLTLVESPQERESPQVSKIELIQ
ncbi:hypothetical protein PoB_007145000 [Plakobranchus ocellatus]|uniref:MADF domain-containing protein n=1 Tax=Plakobranchus ocellatus TaxID=259542 RepID=A0AAV4DM04_9GAST|nr:hypothetical protein PoB_007145000 [Plakobranchus ocellatus]